jgi:hypothetical protein
MPNNTFRESEKAIIIGGIVMSCGNIYDENGKEMSARVGEYMVSEMEKQIHDSQRRLVEEIVKNIEERIHNLKHVYPVTDFAGDGERRDGEITGLEKTIFIINQTLK